MTLSPGASFGWMWSRMYHRCVIGLRSLEFGGMADTLSSFIRPFLCIVLLCWFPNIIMHWCTRWPMFSLYLSVVLMLGLICVAHLWYKAQSKFSCHIYWPAVLFSTIVSKAHYFLLKVWNVINSHFKLNKIINRVWKKCNFVDVLRMSMYWVSEVSTKASMLTS